MYEAIVTIIVTGLQGKKTYHCMHTTLHLIIVYLVHYLNNNFIVLDILILFLQN